MRSADYDGTRFSSGLLATNGEISVSRLSIDLIARREIPRRPSPPKNETRTGPSKALDPGIFRVFTATCTRSTPLR